MENMEIIYLEFIENKELIENLKVTTIELIEVLETVNL